MWNENSNDKAWNSIAKLSQIIKEGEAYLELQCELVGKCDSIC